MASWADDRTLYLSGHVPVLEDGSLITGKCGEGGLTVDEGYDAARWCGLNLLATLAEQLGGDLDRVERIVKVLGVVQSYDGFGDHHLVLNGATDVFVEALGGRGKSARSAIGANSLPLSAAVEVEAVVRVGPISDRIERRKFVLAR